MIRIRNLAFVGIALLSRGFQDFMDARQGERGGEPAVPLAERARLDPIEPNVFTLESETQSVIGAPQIVFARETDTLSLIAREYGLGYDEIVQANPDIDPWLPGEGTPVVLPTQYVLPEAPHEGVVLNIATKRLFYYPPAGEDGRRVVMTFPIGIGRVGWETPLGDASVVSKARDPHWWVPASVRQEHEELGDPLPAVVPPGPDNPLGRFVLKLDMPGYLIHGTNQPYGVGMRVSHGCVRLYPENIEALYPLVAVGARVAIVNQPFLAGWHHGELYFEGHPPLEDDERSPEEHFDNLIARLGEDLSAAELEAARLNAEAIASVGAGIPVRVLRNDMHEIFERARVVRNIVEDDPDVPTLAEVREMLDQPIGDSGEDEGPTAAGPDEADAGE
jgi:L,D-transpeptidase ErfK/SrfK